MILTRTNEQMKKLVPYLQNTGIRFDCKFNDLLPFEVIKAINDWDRLNKGANISGEEAQNIYETKVNEASKEAEEIVSKAHVEYESTKINLQKKIEKEREIPNTPS